MLSSLSLRAASRAALAVVATFSVGSFVVSAAESPAARVRIEEMATPGDANDSTPSRTADSASSLVLFDATTNRLRGWSHLVAPAPELPKPRFAAFEYAIVEGQGGEFQTILVKRLANWDRNHLNGIEPLFAESPLPVGVVAAIVLELRIDSAGSSIPSRAELAARYGSLLTAEQLAELDHGCADLGISVFEAGFNDHDRAVLNAFVIVEFDPARHFDRWLRVTIPVEALEFFFEKNYARTATEREAQLTRSLVGLRINPESATGRTVRHFLQDRFDPQTPETLKEMAITIRRLEIRRR